MYIWRCLHTCIHMYVYIYITCMYVCVCIKQEREDTQMLKQKGECFQQMNLTKRYTIFCVLTVILVSFLKI